jgi:hypothetical protein
LAISVGILIDGPWFFSDSWVTYYQQAVIKSETANPAPEAEGEIAAAEPE